MNKPQNFYIAAHGILRYKNEALALFVKEGVDDAPHDFWTLPGGKIDESEDIMTAFRREVE